MRRVLTIDFVYWFAFAIFQTTFALFAAQRFGFDASQTGYFFAGFGVLGAVIQGGFIRPIVRRLGDKPTFIAGIVFSVVGLVAAAFAHSVALFALALVPLALGMGFGHPTVSSLVSRAGARRRAGARAGRGERRREPGPHDRAGLGQRVASALRRSDAVSHRRHVSRADAAGVVAPGRGRLTSSGR